MWTATEQVTPNSVLNIKTKESVILGGRKLRPCANDVMENYQKKLDELIIKNEEKGVHPSLLLHACCAPCSSYVLEYLSKHFDITVFYYNPNISPAEEYFKRENEIERFIQEFDTYGKVKLIKGDYTPIFFYSSVKGLENEPERGARCSVCFKLRLSETAKRASENGFDYFATTLTLSPLKNARIINEIGEECAREYGSQYLPSDFKKRGGYQRSVVLSAEYGLYRQNYCGCEFSKRGDWAKK